MYSLHVFGIKSSITLSSSSLALSIGFLKFNDKPSIDFTHFLLIGWVLLIISIILSLIAVIGGVGIYTKYHNNILAHGEDNEYLGTNKLEVKIGYLVISSFVLFLLGVSFILAFVYCNLVNQNTNLLG